MKRIVILIDGTWEQEGVGNDTNVGKLDLTYKVAGSSLIKPIDKNGVTQLVVYHKGVGAGVANPVMHWLSALFGEGLRALVLNAYTSLVKLYERDDEYSYLDFLEVRMLRVRSWG